MKYLVPVLIILIISCSTPKEKEVIQFTYPPQWAPQEAVWIDFPDETGWGGGSLPPDYPARIEIIENLVKYVPVNVILGSDSMRNILDSMLTDAEITGEDIHIFQHPDAVGAAIRDYGPVLLTNGESYQMADFGFEGFAGAAFADSSFWARAEIDNLLADSLGYAVKPIDLNSEGGGFITSSKVILLFEAFAEMRNPELTLKEMEQRFLDALGLEKVIWVKEPMLLDKNWHKLGNTYGQGANFHMDAYLRFVNDSTILIPTIDPSIKDKTPLLAADYKASLANLERLKKETNVDGKPFNIVEIPHPDVSLYQYEFPFREGDEKFFNESQPGDTITYVPIMGYSNFLITNGAVLVSEYWREGLPETEKANDQKMKAILKEYFPDRDIIGIKKALMLNWFGGGIHCQTMQIPKIN
ncbi:MAG: agmatine deiminase family protein [Bacteroidota bacterium]